MADDCVRPCKSSVTNGNRLLSLVNSTSVSASSSVSVASRPLTGAAVVVVVLLLLLLNVPV